LKDRYQVLLGILAAGNDSKELFNELNGIADTLFQKDFLTEEQLKKISKLNV
jgi:hypothetical protein